MISVQTMSEELLLDSHLYNKVICVNSKREIER
jgi:hypothetical protein